MILHKDFITMSLGAPLAVVKFVVGVREEAINFYHLVPSVGV